jgi:hypothetical protein
VVVDEEVESDRDRVEHERSAAGEFVADEEIAHERVVDGERRDVERVALRSVPGALFERVEGGEAEEGDQVEVVFEEGERPEPLRDRLVTGVKLREDVDEAVADRDAGGDRQPDSGGPPRAGRERRRRGRSRARAPVRERAVTRPTGRAAVACIRGRRVPGLSPTRRGSPVPPSPATGARR